MRVLSSAVSADSISASESHPPGSASTTSTAEPCSNDIGRECPCTPTCESSEKTHPELTCCTAATPANPSASQGNEREQTTRGICGPSSPDSFAFYDPASSSLKTCQATLDLDSTPSLPTLPAWGWMSGGELYERVMSAPLTNALDCSWLLPTPSSGESTPTDEYVSEMVASGIQPDERLYLPGRKWHAQRTLSRVAPALLQTPSAADAMGGHLSRGGSRSHELLLKGQVKALPTPRATRGGSQTETVALLPTPMAHDGTAGGKDAPNRTGGASLSHTLLLPTPTREADSGGYNPAWGHGVTLADAARIVTTGTAVPTGVSIPPPSDDGKPSTAQPHHQLTIEAD